MSIAINFWAVLVCGIVAMVLGFLWYGPLFGKLWMKLEGMPVDAMERAKNDPAMKRKMYWSYVISFVAALVAAFVLTHALAFAEAYLGWSGVGAGIFVGVLGWLGFTVPPTLGMVLWEGKSWKLWALINAYWVVLFALMGAILAVWM